MSHTTEPVSHAVREEAPARGARSWGSRLRHAPILGYYTGALLITDISLLVIPYAYTDDYSTLNNAIHHTLAGTLKVRIGDGRLLQAGVIDLAFSLIGSLNDLVWLRLLGVVTLAALAWMLYGALVRAGWEPRWAFPLPLIICTLPSLQIYPAWALASLELLAVIPAGCGALLVERACEVAATPGGTRNRWWKVGGLAAAATLMLLCSLMLHQAEAMVYWVFAGIALLARRHTTGDLLRRFLSYLGVATVAMGAEYLVVKYSYTLLFHQPNPEARTKLASLAEVQHSVVLFFTQPVAQSLTFYHIQPEPWNALAAGAIAVFIVCGFILYVGESLARVLVKLALAFTLLPLAYIPNLLVASWWPAYRTQSALGGLLALYLACAVRGYLGERRAARIRALAPMSLWAFAGLGMICAAVTVTNGMALPSYIELHVAIAQVERQRAELASASQVYFIQNDPSDAVTSAVLYDEYGDPSADTWKWWTPPAISYQAISAVDPMYANLPVVIAHANQAPPPGSVVVDMRQLRSFGVLPLP